MKIYVYSRSKIYAEEHIVAPKYNKAKHEIKILVVEVPANYKGPLGAIFDGFSLNNCLKLFNLESKYLLIYDIYYGADHQNADKFFHGDLEDLIKEQSGWTAEYSSPHKYKYHFRYDSGEGVVFAKYTIRKEDAYDEATYENIYELLLPYLNAYYGTASISKQLNAPR